VPTTFKDLEDEIEDMRNATPSKTVAEINQKVEELKALRTKHTDLIDDAMPGDGDEKKINKKLKEIKDALEKAIVTKEDSDVAKLTPELKRLKTIKQAAEIKSTVVKMYEATLLKKGLTAPMAGTFFGIFMGGFFNGLSLSGTYGSGKAKSALEADQAKVLAQTDRKDEGYVFGLEWYVYFAVGTYFAGNLAGFIFGEGYVYNTDITLKAIETDAKLAQKIAH